MLYFDFNAKLLGLEDVIVKFVKKLHVHHSILHCRGGAFPQKIT